MSGRAYARNAQGFLGGGADLESIVPHTFRVAAPKRGNSARELAIRRVIRRRCMEKNWKKLISRRHTRLTKSDAASEPNKTEAAAGAADQSDATAAVATTATADAESKEKQLPVSNGTAVKPPEKKSEGSASTGTKAAENGARKPKQEKKPDSETVDLAKRQLEELEAKLQTLVEQKHAKFLQLKNILVEEARSKSSSGSPAPAPLVTTPAPAPAGASAPGPSKKRRVDFKEASAANTGSPRGGAQPQGEQSVVPPLGSPLPAAAASASSSSSGASSEPVVPGNASSSE